MGLWRDVVISIYYMSNGLTFEIRYIILRYFQGCWDSFEKQCLQNFMKICLELTEKSTKNMRSWLITFNVTLGIITTIVVLNLFYLPVKLLILEIK